MPTLHLHLNWNTFSYTDRNDAAFCRELRNPAIGGLRDDLGDVYINNISVGFSPFLCSTVLAMQCYTISGILHPCTPLR